MPTALDALTQADVAAHVTALKRFARSLVRDEAAADEIVQDAFLIATVKKSLQPENWRGWLMGVAKNLARDRHRLDRHRSEREHRATEAARVVGRSEDLLERFEVHRHLAGLIWALDEPYRSTVLECYFEGLSPSEVAQRNGIPAGTVRWRLKHALDRIRTALDRNYGHDRDAWRALLLPIADLPRPGPRSSATLGKVMLMGAGAAVMVTVLVAGGLRQNRGTNWNEPEAPASRMGTMAEMTPGPPIGAGARPPNAGSAGEVAEDLGAGLQLKDRSSTTVMFFDFEDGLLPSMFTVGQPVPGPFREGNRHCVMGVMELNGNWLSNVVLGSVFEHTNVFSFSRKISVAFDYWIGEPGNPAVVLKDYDTRIIVQVWNNENHGNYRRSLSLLSLAQWGHGEVKLADFIPYDASKGPMDEGDSLRNLAFSASFTGGKPFYLDNIHVVTW